MAKQEFLRNVRVARNLFVHRVDANGSRTDANAAARHLTVATLWLTPDTVSAFDPGDFEELSDDSRAELVRLVEEFREIAERIPESGPAAPDLESAASRTFLRLIEILEPYFPTPEELKKLRSAMKDVPFPESAETWDYEFGRDSSDEPAVWIWVIMNDAVADDPGFARNSLDLRREIHRSVQRAGIDRWPYVRFRTHSEQKSLRVLQASVQ